MANSLWPTHWFGLLLVSATSGVVLVIIAWSIQVALQRRRLERFKNLELIPNILLTRHPVLFIGRNRSLFRLSGDFLELPIYLKEHGFQVEEIELQTRGLNSATLIKCIASLLSQTTLNSPNSSTAKTHLFLSEDFADAALDLAFDGHPGLASLTVIGVHQINRMQLRPPRVPLFLRPDLKPKLAKFDFQTERSVLDHVVSLAESDLR
jgi:hypothetical protein